MKTKTKTKSRWWTCDVHGSRLGTSVRAKISFRLLAETRDEAEALVHESLPGFDWVGWNSVYGVVPDEDDQG